MPAPTTIASSFVFFVPFDSLDLISAWSISLSYCFYRATRPNRRSCVSLAIQRNCWAVLRSLKGFELLTHRRRTCGKLVARRHGGLERSRPFFGRNGCAAQRTPPGELI